MTGAGRSEWIEDDERLPWLEAAVDSGKPGPTASRARPVALTALALLAAFSGGTYWLLTREGSSAKEADRSTIEAPQALGKNRPRDPTQATALGSEVTSFPAAADRSSAARAAPSKTPVRESIAVEQERAPPSGGVGVQVGAYANRDRADEGWKTLIGRHPLLQRSHHRIVQARVDRRTIYRLQAIARDRAEARQLCDSLKAEGADCWIHN